MEAKTALVIAVLLAFGLPYLTVALLEGGSAGTYVVALLFVGAVVLVVLSDMREDGDDAEAVPEDAE